MEPEAEPEDDSLVASPLAAAEALAAHARIEAAVKRASEAQYELARLLWEMKCARHHLALGYGTILAYASAAHGLSTAVTRSLIRIGRGLQALPRLERSCRDGELPWTKVRELVRVATEDTEEAWIEQARDVSCRDLERLVARAEPGEPPPDADVPEKAPPRCRLTFEVDASERDIVRRALAVLGHSLGTEEREYTDGALLAAMAHRMLELLGGEPEAHVAPSRHQVILEYCPGCGATSGVDWEMREAVAEEAYCDAEVVDLRPGREGERSRTIPLPVRRAVLARDRYRCVVPGCRNWLWVDVHHFQAFADGGAHSIDNLGCVCTAHHRLVHEGVLAMVPLGGGRLRITHLDGRVETVALGGRPLPTADESRNPDVPRGTRRSPAACTGADRHTSTGASSGPRPVSGGSSGPRPVSAGSSGPRPVSPDSS